MTTDGWAFLFFFLTTALAVVLPLFSNLPLVPFAVLFWSPWPIALILILGWVAGASISFELAKRLQAPMIRHFPALPITSQLMVFGASAALFAVYVVWAVRHRH